MTLKQRLLYRICKEVCDYLKLDENLFFADKVSKNIRIQEGRKLVCYLAVKCFNIDFIFIARFMGYNRTERAKIAYTLVDYSICVGNVQVEKDVEALERICYGIDADGLGEKAA